jgi:hypothetical protein
MNNPYRIHSTICVNFLQLLMMSTIAYPIYTPPIFHNIVVTRIISTVYLGFFPESRISFIFDCCTMGIKMISDTLYIRYIVTNYTAIFGILDIASDIIFLYMVVRPNQTISNLLTKFFEYCGCKFNYNTTESEQQETYLRYSREYDNTRGHYVYSTIPTSKPLDNTTPQPPSPPPPQPPLQVRLDHITTFSSQGPIYDGPQSYNKDNVKPYIQHQPRHLNPFKQNFYKSSLQNTIENEYEKIDRPIPTMAAQLPPHNQSKNTMYVNFDEYDNGASNYANTFVTPYFDRNGNPITSLLCKENAQEILFIIGSVLHFIYQIMIYTNIINTCKTYNTTLDYTQNLLC